jgi:AAA family ATP:ADP antiporter
MAARNIEGEDPGAPSQLERFLNLFTEMRSGEGVTALLMFANVFLILCAYYLIKPLREGWIAVAAIEGLEKMEVKAYSSFGQALLLIPIVAFYGRLSERWNRATLITGATLFCMSNMLIFWFLQPDFFIPNLPWTGIAFYLWVGMFGVFVVAQFWAFAADLYPRKAGERLLPFIAIGATAGAAGGSWITERLVSSGWVPTEALLLVATLPLAASIGLTRLADRRESRALPAGEPPAPPSSSNGPSGLSIVLASRFLLATAMVTLLLSWVNTNGENLLFRVVQEVLASDAVQAGVSPGALIEYTRDGTTVFYGNFYFWVNSIALILQAFVASRLLKYGGFGAILLAMPAVALVSYSAMALVPVLAIVKIMKVAENATDYSINNTARHVLWLPISSEAKYKGKPTIDTLFVRVGDGLAAATVLVGVHFLALPTASYFVINVGLALVWLALGFVVVREYRRLSEREESQG